MWIPHFSVGLLTPGLENLGLTTPVPTLRLKSDPIPTLGLIMCHTACVQG